MDFVYDPTAFDDEDKTPTTEPKTYEPYGGAHNMTVGQLIEQLRHVNPEQPLVAVSEEYHFNYIRVAHNDAGEVWLELERGWHPPTWTD